MSGTNNYQTGFLLIHGFTGTHYEMEPLEDFLLKKGFIVDNITLPGHETSEDDLINTNWKDWVNHAQLRLDYLKKECQKVYVCGLSLGGAITLYLGARNPDLAGIIPMAAVYKTPDWRLYLLAFIPIAHLLYPRHQSKETGWDDLEALENHKCYENYPTRSVLDVYKLLRAVKKSVPDIKIPTLVIQGKKDPSVPSSFPKWIYKNISSKSKKLVWIEKGGHVIPEDAGRFQLFEEIDKWVKEL